MTDPDQTIAEASAALDRLTVDCLEHVDTATLRSLAALTYHWSEVIASVIEARAPVSRELDAPDQATAE